ncbi:unnamed protein product, partial [Didymodactylos carnosus]
NPVLAEDGYTYERDAIIEWIQRDGTSPMTRQPLSIDRLQPNRAVRALVDDIKADNKCAVTYSTMSSGISDPPGPLMTVSFKKAALDSKSFTNVPKIRAV